MYNFASDYLEGCTPEILEALIKVNYKQSPGYGEDEYSRLAKQSIAKAIGRNDVDIHFVPGGTPCNILGICSCLKDYQAVICAESGHINVHETGAIEAAGHKILTAPGSNGKISAAEIEAIVKKHTDEHMVQPKMVFISQASEFGTIYSLEELEAIAAVCRQYQLYLYVDGARLANALVAKGNDVSLANLAELADMFYIGGTKNGALLGEAMVIVNDELKKDFRFRLKQRGAMLAKARIMGVSFFVLFNNDLYLKLANHANKMADALRFIFKTYNIPQYIRSNTNQTFVVISNELLKKIQENYIVTVWGPYDNTHSIVRFVTSWCTKEEAILQFAEFIKQNH